MFSKLKSKLHNNKEYTLVALINSKGSGGGRSQGEEDWTFSFKADVWYREKGSIEEKTITISKQVDHDTLKRLMDQAKRESIIKVKVFKRLRVNLHYKRFWIVI